MYLLGALFSIARLISPPQLMIVRLTFILYNCATVIAAHMLLVLLTLMDRIIQAEIPTEYFQLFQGLFFSFIVEIFEVKMS